MNQEGQAFTEYLVMIVAVLSFYLIVVGFINRFGLQDKLAGPIQQQFAKTYQYGSPKVLGFDDGGPQDHPRVDSAGNFRIFINPRSASQ